MKKEYEMGLLERVIKSVDDSIFQLRCTPWAFRLEDGRLVADPDCYFEHMSISGDVDEKRMQYNCRIWDMYKDKFDSPFVPESFRKLEEFEWLDIINMTWTEISERFLYKELPLIRTFLKTDGFSHQPVPELISDRMLNQLIAYRYKEWLLQWFDYMERQNGGNEI